MFEIKKVSGIGGFETEKLNREGKDDYGGRDEEEVRVYKVPGGKAFLVERLNTIEVRTDAKLGKLLVEKYESVMKSRYFGKGGIEIVLAGRQLREDELYDLVRLSYNLTREAE